MLEVLSRQGGLFHILDICKETLPRLFIPFRHTVEERVDGLVTEARSAAAAQSYRPVPLGADSIECHQRVPVLGPYVDRVLPVIFGKEALGYLG